jgi:serine protease Do
MSEQNSRERGGASVLRWIAGVILLVLAMKFLVEPMVESIQHAITRGHERAKAEVAQTQLASLSDTSAAFRLVAQSVGPSVVHIKTVRAPKAFEKDAADEWASLYPDRPPRNPSGEGSGLIVDAAGYVLTNNHVIEDASNIQLKLSDGRTVRQCQVIGADQLTDLAVLKIDLEGLTAANWGNSDTLEVGDWVLAVGNPFGLDRSVTAGIVSAKERRNVVSSLPYQDFLQTDAAVNPGNSGGPLVNLRGEVVGINTAIVGDAFQGISFAIPSSIAREVYQRLRTTGRASHGWLGVGLRPLEEDLQEELGGGGVMISSVFRGSPAAAAGLKQGDIILRFNDHSIAEPTELSVRVARSAIHSKARIVISRDGEEVELVVAIGERPPNAGR